eukprot:318481-Pyramimonas_sp.AAC.1
MQSFAPIRRLAPIDKNSSIHAPTIDRACVYRRLASKGRSGCSRPSTPGTSEEIASTVDPSWAMWPKPLRKQSA